MDARLAMWESASDSERGGASESGVDMRMLGGTVLEMREGRSGKERDWSMREMWAGEGPM